MVLRDRKHTADDRKKCADLLANYDVTEWQLGKTKVQFENKLTFTYMSVEISNAIINHPC